MAELSADDTCFPAARFKGRKTAGHQRTMRFRKRDTRAWPVYPLCAKAGSVIKPVRKISYSKIYDHCSQSWDKNRKLDKLSLDHPAISPIPLPSSRLLNALD